MKQCGLSVLIASFAILGMAVPAVAQSRLGLKTVAGNISPWMWFGTSVAIDLIRGNADNGVYNGFVTGEFNMIEPENDFKPPSVWTGEHSYAFQDPNSNINWLLGTPGQTGWAQQHGMTVRGHVLVYARDDGYTIPGWLLNNESRYSANQAQQLLHDYINALVGQYRGKIPTWDVVNEAISDNAYDTNQTPTGVWVDAHDENGTWVNAHWENNDFHLRNSFWYRKLGKNFIKLAFQWAHAADSNADLYINEYGAERGGQKSDDLYNIAKWLHDSGIWYSGVGLQFHYSVYDSIAPGDGHYQNAQRLKNYGIPFFITELDAWMPVTDSATGYNPSNPNDLNSQANVYRSVMNLALAFDNCHGFQIWGASDKHSWIPAFAPGHGAATISNQYYQPKPAYWSLLDAMGHIPGDGVFSVAPQHAPGYCLDTYGSNGIQLYSYWGGSNQKWQTSWQNDGTYRLSPLSNSGAGLDTFDTFNSSGGGVQVYNFWGGANQKWIITPTSRPNNGWYRISPANAPWRTLDAYQGGTSRLDIWDWNGGSNQLWSLTYR